MPFVRAIDQIMRLGKLAAHHPMFCELAKSIDSLVDAAIDLEDAYLRLTPERNSLISDVQADLEAARSAA